jgi:arylsulfatase A-like enzyme
MARNPVPGSSYGLNPSERTIAELLKIEGYATMCIGKWHLGDAIDFLPTRQGFDEYFGIPFSNDMWRYHPKMAPSEDEDSLMHAIRTRAAYTGFAGQGTFYPEDGGFPNDLPLMKNERVTETNPDQRFLTSRYTETALEFIEKNQQQPFFLYLAHAMPHVPLFVSPEFDGKSQRGLYGDAVMEIDWSVGQIMEKLHQLSIDTNTLIIFMSDNGPWLSYGIDGGSAGPLRDGKESEYEGGFRVPAIFWLPGQISGGKRNSQITGNMDILPTIASLIGSRLDDDVKIDGVDISSILTGKGSENIDRYFHYFGPSAGGKVNYMGIRDNRWKLLFNVTEAGDFSNVELYDLYNDVSERFNRLEQHPLEAERLKNVASEYFKCLNRSLRPAGKI